MHCLGTKTDSPRGNLIFLGEVSHTDRVNLGHVNHGWTSSNVDAHRIKDVSKMYKPTVEGCTVTLQNVTDNSDPQNPVDRTEISVTSGKFFNYCADPSKQLDNYFTDIVAIPAPAPFLFRSTDPTDPKDYGENWNISDTSTKNTELKDAKTISSTGVLAPLPDGNTTLYPIMMNYKGELLIIVPRMAYPASGIPNIDGDEAWRELEKAIDRGTLENYARLGFLYADQRK